MSSFAESGSYDLDSDEELLSLADVLVDESWLGVATGQMDVIEAILDACGFDEDLWARVGVQCMREALGEEQIDCVKELLRFGVHPHVYYDGVTCSFIHAAKYHSKEEIELFLDHGADANFCCHSRTALYFALEHDDTSKIRLLLERGAAPDHLGENLSAMMRVRSLEAAKLVFDYGAEVNVTDGYGNSPLSFAVQNRAFDIAAFLLELGADPDLCFGEGAITSLLVNLVELNSLSFVKLLVKHGAFMEARPFCETPLTMAASEFTINVDIVRCLLEHGANARAEARGRWTALHYIAEQSMNRWMTKASEYQPREPQEMGNIVTCIRMLVKYGANPNAAASCGRTPLSLALDKNDWRMVEALVQHGATDPGSAHKDSLRNGKTRAMLVLRGHLLQANLRKFRGIARFIIVALRYRESFYREKYATIGAQSFHMGKRQLEATNLSCMSSPKRKANTSLTHFISTINVMKVDRP